MYCRNVDPGAGIKKLKMLATYVDFVVKTHNHDIGILSILTKTEKYAPRLDAGMNFIIAKGVIRGTGSHPYPPRRLCVKIYRISKSSGYVF